MSAIRGALVWKKRQKLLRARGVRYRDSGLLFTGEFGRPLNPSNIRVRDHYPRLERLGLPRTWLYDLRHFHVTFLAAEGVDYRAVADRVGHKSPKFTISRYTYASYQAQVRAVAVTDDLLTKVSRYAR